MTWNVEKHMHKIAERQSLTAYALASVDEGSNGVVDVIGPAYSTLSSDNAEKPKEKKYQNKE